MKTKSKSQLVSQWLSSRRTEKGAHEEKEIYHSTKPALVCHRHSGGRQQRKEEEDERKREKKGKLNKVSRNRGKDERHSRRRGKRRKRCICKETF